MQQRCLYRKITPALSLRNPPYVLVGAPRVVHKRVADCVQHFKPLTHGPEYRLALVKAGGRATQGDVELGVGSGCVCGEWGWGKGIDLRVV